MTTNKIGYVAISKSAHNPKKELDMTPIVAIFGYKGAKLKRAEEFYKKLKTKVGDRARVRVLQEIVKNAQTNGYGWTCIDDIQDAWKEAQSEEDIETLASKIKKCIHSGYFEESDDMKKHWSFKMEQELMEEFKVVYVKGDKNKSLGCIAKQVSWARADVYKRIGRQGKRVHKHCPTIRGIGVKKSIGKEEENPIPKKQKQIQQVQIMNNKARNDLATTRLAIMERSAADPGKLVQESFVRYLVLLVCTNHC
jgi:hypothetical protein